MLKKMEDLKEYKIEIALQSRDEREVTEKVHELMVCLKNLYRTNEFSSLEQLVRIQSRKLARTADTEKSKHAVAYHIGFAMGTFDILKEILCCYYEQQTLTQLVEESMQSKIPHVEEIIAVLRKESMIQHGHLAKRIGIDKSTLTPIIKQMERCRMIDVMAPGKFKYYSLSDAGRRFADRVFPFLPQNESVFHMEFRMRRTGKIAFYNERVPILTNSPENNRIEGPRKEFWGEEDWNNESIPFYSFANQ